MDAIRTTHFKTVKLSIWPTHSNSVSYDSQDKQLFSLKENYLVGLYNGDAESSVWGEFLMFRWISGSLGLTGSVHKAVSSAIRPYVFR